MEATIEATAEELRIAEEMGPENGDVVERDENGELVAPQPEEPDEAELLLQQQQSEKEIEKRNRALDKESERHEKRIHEILGDDGADLIDCEACHPGVPGYHFPADNYAPGTPERALYEMLSAGETGQMRHPAYLETCDECNGFGQVLTGARTDLTRLLACPKCKQAGYIDTRNAQTEPTPPAPVTGDLTVVATPPAPVEPEQDMWGRPVGHVRFGKFPIYLTDEERAADLAEGFTIE